MARPFNFPKTCWLISTNKHDYQTLLLLLLVYFVLAHIYSLTTPLFEAPDAYYHFAVIEHVSRTGNLPSPESAQDQPWHQMVFHAPLYYYICAALIDSIDTSDFLAKYPPNPHAQIGNPAAANNRNFVAHSGDAWRDTGLAVRIVQEFSIVLGAVTLIAVYWLALQLWPQQRYIAYLAVMVVLFNPQFLYLSGVVNNDNLVTALAAVCLALLVYIVHKGITPPLLILLAVLVALASLAKASGFTLYPVVCAAILWVCWRDKVPLRRVVIYALVGLIVFLVIAGWWYLKNWQHYGDPSATNMVAEATQRRFGSIDLLAEMRGLFYSFWGLFGWFNILTPQSYYGWIGIILVIAMIGMVWNLVISRPELTPVPVILILYMVIFLVSWWRFETMVLAAQGRLWFPLYSVFACFIAYGLSALRRYAVLLLLPLMMAAIAFPFTYIHPAYAGAAQIAKTVWQPLDGAVAISFREPWQESACVLLWLSPAPISKQDNFLVVDLAWEASCSVTGYWSVFAHLSDLSLESCQVGDTKHVLSQYDSMPVAGNTPFPAIKPGYVIRDRIIVPIPEASSVRDLHLQIGLYDAGGTFIRAFVSPESTYSEQIFVGRCSPELVNIAIPSDLVFK